MMTVPQKSKKKHSIIFYIQTCGKKTPQKQTKNNSEQTILIILKISLIYYIQIML